MRPACQRSSISRKPRRSAEEVYAAGLAVGRIARRGEGFALGFGPGGGEVAARENRPDG